MDVFFINSTSGKKFSLYHPPSPNVQIKKNILFIPPFAEELNRSRHMINRQARCFAKAGFGVLIPDFYGTGDSEGTFGEATIEIWRQDILAAVAWLQDKSDEAPILWAMRSGALIAMDIIQQKPDLTEQIILWSPVTDGKKFISQYLRLKITAEVTKKNRDTKTTIKDLWARLDSGHNLEIAGYDLSSELATGFSVLSLKNMKIPEKLSVKWLETSVSEPERLSPASRKIIEIWKNDHIDVTGVAIDDAAFWTFQEPEWANKYIDQTMSFIAE